MNEYQVTPYKNGEAAGDTWYFTNRQSALKHAHEWLSNGGDFIDEVDMQVIYDYKDDDSELSSAWWSITLQDYARPALNKKLVVTRMQEA